jgi:NADP-dependent 3-hydroxy acid dehydrogenase YdfG
MKINFQILPKTVKKHNFDIDIDICINNGGLALGSDDVAHSNDSDWPYANSAVYCATKAAL